MDFKPDRYGKMQYRHCGKWGLKLPVISLGGWQTVGGYEEQGEAKQSFFQAFDAGITHFDFANNYGTPPGNGEIKGGKILKHLPRDEIVISSKAGYYMWPGPYGEWGSRKYIIASCDQSLKRMNVDYFDIFYIHRPDQDTPLEETHGALETLIQQGKVLYGGVSSYSPQMTEAAIALKKKKNWFPLTIHQPVYNMFDRWIEDGLIPSAAKHGYGLIPFCPLAQGLLTNKYIHGVPENSRLGLHGNGPSEEQLRKVKALHGLAAERGQSLAQMALAWILRWKEVTSVLTAVSNTVQLEDSLKILDHLEFSAGELQRIESILGGVPAE
ncbi:MAG TPA: aldo/keto reductase [Bacilli bacterium]